MGYATYVEFANPMAGRTNYVATRRTLTLRDGFLPVADLSSFLSVGFEGDLWIIGGASLFAATLDAVQVLELTRVEGDFGCNRFLPAFETMFRLEAEEVPPRVEGLPAIRFQTWLRV